MDTDDIDIAIIGTGPVGCALALALARHAPAPQRIALFGRRPTTRTPGQAIDPRTLALNHGSRQWLDLLGAWPARAAAIDTVHVSQAGHAGRTLIEHADLGVPRLGSVVLYDDLLEALHATLERSGIRRIAERPRRPHPGRPVQLRLPPAARLAGPVDTAPKGNPPASDEGPDAIDAAGAAPATGRLRARIAVISDGERPRGVQREYDQHAVLATVRAEAPRAGLAYERFTRQGPLALLPHPDGADLYSLVWCAAPARASELAALDPAGFSQALQAAFGHRLGGLRLAGERHVFPLGLHAGPALQGTGIVTLGNAAQTVHPVAGQGLNLGLRDAAQLAHVLGPWLLRPDTDPQPLLDEYASRRRLDRGLTLAITDTLPRALATDQPLRRHLGGAALAALDLVPFLRRPFARHLLQGQRQ